MAPGGPPPPPGAPGGFAAPVAYAGHDKEVTEVLGVLFAFGVFLNNPSREVFGIKFNSYLKVQDVKAKKKPEGISATLSLMHVFVQFLKKDDSKYHHLENWPEKVPSVDQCVQAVEVLQTNINALERMKKMLTASMARFGEDSDFQALKRYFGDKLTDVDTALSSYNATIKTCEEKVVFFGEQSGKDIKGFLETFCKFRDHYNTSVKFIDVLKKKEAAMEAKKQKEEEKLRVQKKLENTAILSCANVEDFGDSEIPLSGFFAQPQRRKQSQSEDNVSAQDEADAIVNDLLKGGGARERRERKKQGGAEAGVGDVAKDARSGEAFQTLRKKKRMRRRDTNFNMLSDLSLEEDNKKPAESTLSQPKRPEFQRKGKGGLARNTSSRFNMAPAAGGAPPQKTRRNQRAQLLRQCSILMKETGV